MKFTCEKTQLVSAISVASRTVAQKSAITGLEGILVRAGVKVMLTGYNLETGITVSVDADVQENGACIMPARLFFDIVRKLPDDTVSIQVDENFKVSIKGGISSFTITALSADDYPELPDVDSEKGIRVPQCELKAMISGTIFAVSENQARPIHTGILFEVDNDSITSVAVDGYRLALRREPVEGYGDDCSFIVPGTALSDLERLCGDSDERVVLSVGSKHISFTVGNTVILSRRLEGDFLNYKKAIPESFRVTVKTARTDLLEVVERVSLIIDSKNNAPLRLTFRKDAIDFVCTTPLGKAADSCPCEGDGGDLEIGFNDHYLSDALKAAPADELNVCLNTGSSPCIFVPADGSDNFVYMVLPVRLRAGQ